MGRALAVVYGVVSYLIFFISSVYTAGFIGNMFVPKGIDSGTETPFSLALLINIVLITLFAIQHSVMARPEFKKWWTQIVPQPVERSTYVLISSLLLLLLCWQWRPMTGEIWRVENTIGHFVLQALFWSGWLLVVLSTFFINHFDMFGLRQVYLYQRGKECTDSGFSTPFLYKLIRHPIMLGFIIAFWATPTMTVGHLVFAIVTTAYILIALQLEERDLVNSYGEIYRDYQRRVSMLLPLPKKR